MRQRVIAVAVIAASFALLAGNANSADRSRALLTAVSSMLAGQWELSTSPGELAAGFELRVIPVQAPLVAERVLYIAEFASNEPERVTRQYILALAGAKRREQVQSALFALSEPLRWRGGLQQPELFRSMVMEDLRPASSCGAWVWRRDGKAALLATSPAPECAGTGMKLTTTQLEWDGETGGSYRRRR